VRKMTNAAPGAALPATSDDRTGHLTSTPAAPLPASKNTPQLRDYQQTGVDEIRAHFASGISRVCYQLPTGGGKTITFAYITTAAVVKGSRVLILVHRIELIEQIAATLARFGVPYGVIAAGCSATPEAPVQVASVQTLVNREVGDFDLVVVDESHHAVAASWRTVLDALPNSKVLGVSATPERLDGKGLGDVFNTLVIGPTMRWLIDNGYLAPYVAFGPKKAPDLRRIKVTAGDYNTAALADAMSDRLIIQSAVDEYRRICDGAPALVFSVNLDHSRLVAKAFSEAGYRAAHVDGTTPKDERKDAIAALGGGRIQVLSNCQLFDEGLDVPGVVAAILLRPTMSVARYLQMVGRALRPGKPRAFILDHAGCVAAHGLPDDAREWSLEGREKEERDKYRDRSRQCESCGAFSPYTATHCRECGHAFPVREKAQPEKIDVPSSLVEIKPAPALSPAQPREPQARWVPIDSLSAYPHAKPGKMPTLRLQYRSSNATYYEWLALEHSGYGRDVAVRKWQRLGGRLPVPTTVAEALSRRHELATPDAIFVQRNGSYWQVITHRTSQAVSA
jgi:DNA repair protein RadD